MSIQFWVYIGLSFLSFSGLLFGVFWLKNLIKDQVLSQAVLKNDNHDLWGMFPGKSKIILHKFHYFYNFTNVDDFFQNQTPIVQEKGPYNIFENQEFLNYSFVNGNDSVRYKFFRYYNGTQEDYQTQSNQSIYTLNLPALAVWYQIKTITKPQVGLKALYTVMTSLQIDFFINVCIQMLQTSANNFNNFLSLLSMFSHLTPQQLSLMYTDPKYGFNSTTAFFARALLLHPSEDSRFFQNYYNLTYFDITQLSKHILNKVEELIPVFLNQRQVKQEFSPLNLSLIQWRDTSIALDSLIKFNSTTPGYVEYGAYLKNFTNYTTTLTVAQCEKLLAFNDAVPTNKSVIVRLSKLFNPNYSNVVDDSFSLLNKGNLDKILSYNDSEAISFINNNLQINNTAESSYIYRYLNYLCDEIAFQKSLGGTTGIGGMSDFLSSQFFDVINSISNSIFNNYMSIKLYQTVFQDRNCEEQLISLIKLDINYKEICANPALNTTNRKNLNVWISGILFDDPKLQQILNLTDLQLVSLKDTPFANLLVNLVEDFMSKYNITGNYKSMNLIPLGVSQWHNSSITNDDDFGNLKTLSVKDWDPETFKKYIPEIGVYCLKYSFKCTSKLPPLEEIQAYMSFDSLFSGLFLQKNVFIPFFNSTVLNKTSLSTSTMVSYLKYIFTEKILGGLFVTRSVYELIWGYTDPFLDFMKNNNYYLGGDPTLDSKFSLGQNMTQPPQGEDVYFEINTGNKDKKKTRSYSKVFGYTDSKMMIREKYFDGKTIKTSFRHPWNEPVDVEGTDAMSFRPDNLEKGEIVAFLDDLYRNGGFHYYNSKVHKGLTTNRYILNENTILSKKYNPDNEKYFSDKFNGYSNMSSIIKAPFFAHKPYYYQCNDTPAEMLPKIKLSNWTYNASGDKDDQTLFNDSFIDIEPYSGATIRAGQKIMISALIERDELFEIDSKFVPIYYVFRTANFSDAGINELFGDLITGLGVKSLLNVLFVTLLTLFLCLASYIYIKGSQTKVEETKSDSQV